ncbi:unnamed protein product [Rhizoctonia solani]|uniref:Uncharacterized protein n=1 Tax=Rhizoctonia solani TaxID=456999 RepID=A0A8H3E5Z1_9AGAM|nr:unnamed protein product [Rhizoctonia solani]
MCRAIMWSSLIISGQPAIDRDPRLKAAEVLARHLHNGTRPGDSNARSGKDTYTPARKISVHCVAIEGWIEIKNMSVWNDELKARFPPGTEHIICGTFHDKNYRSCSSAFDLTGNLVSRELYITQDTYWAMWIYSTRHVAYFTDDDIPQWDKLGPAWTQTLSSHPSGVHDINSSSVRPAGMHNHSLRMYKDLPWRGESFSMFVWKSSHGGDNLDS